MNDKLMKVLNFMQRLQFQSLQKGAKRFDIMVFSYFCPIRNHVCYAISYNYSTDRDNHGLIGTLFHEKDCKRLGDAIKDIRAFLKKA